MCRHGFDNFLPLGVDAKAYVGRVAEIYEEAELTGYLHVTSDVYRFSSGPFWKRKWSTAREMLKWNVVRIQDGNPIEYLDGEYEDEESALSELRSGIFSIWGERGLLRWVDDRRAAFIKKDTFGHE
jgi:hypothetical protein